MVIRYLADKVPLQFWHRKTTEVFTSKAEAAATDLN